MEYIIQCRVIINMNTKIKILADSNKTVIVSHGFGSDLNSPTAQKAFNFFPEHNMGVALFDFPGHGRGESSKDRLTVKNCLSYLREVENFILSRKPEEEILYFSSSFGAFINTIYLCTMPHKGIKSFFRSGAVNMPDLFADALKEELPSMKENIPIVLSDYEPPLKIYREFLLEMSRFNLYSIWKDHYKNVKGNIAMVHGSEDEVIELNAAKTFAALTGAHLYIIEGGTHRLMERGQPNKVFKLALNFFVN